MGLSIIKQTDEPDFKDGEEGGGDSEPVCCEWCEEYEFALWTWKGLPAVVCTSCHMPQTSVFWLDATEEA